MWQDARCWACVPFAAGDIYGALSVDGIFRDLADLVGSLEWMREKGHVIRDGLDRYRWVWVVKYISMEYMVRYWGFTDPEYRSTMQMGQFDPFLTHS